METKRVFYFDALRILSILCVIGIHATGSFWPVRPLFTGDWWTLDFYNAVVRFSVPALFMLSGALQLSPGRDVTVESLYKKSIPRIALALIFWTVLYAAVRTLFHFALGLRDASALWGFFLECLGARMHFWFLYTIIGLYCVTPLLRPIAAAPALRRYFLILALLFGSLLPTLKNLFPSLGFLQELAGRLELTYVLGYSGCYVLGFALSDASLSKKAEAALYATGALGFLLTFFGTAYMSRAAGYLDLSISDGPALNLIMMAAGMFTFFQQRVSRLRPGPKLAALTEQLSQSCFGIYLVHMFFIELFNAIGFSTELFAPILSVPVISCTVFLLSGAAAAILRRIPFFRKYLT